ncbi:MAG: DUF3572 family protein [Devosia nanyangense]|uniref:DUF3572 family protein n=1 Tax=Devosia nanyangense TaxID=1228055 RepID=A0A933NZT5_9HYPH|nr:DUF3572 family protein [Devosia nanyangense]
MALKPTTVTLKELAELSLQYLAKNPDLLAEFMIQSGIDPKGLRRFIGTDEFAHGLVDHVVSNEPLLLAIAAENKLKPESIVAAWAKLHQAEG